MGTKIKWGAVVVGVLVLVGLLASDLEEREGISRGRRQVRLESVDRGPSPAGSPAGIPVPPVSSQKEATGPEEMGALSTDSGRQDPGGGQDYVEHEILVQFAPKMDKEEIVNLLDGLGMSIEKILNGKNLCRVRLPEDLHVQEALQLFEGVPGILFSEPNYLIRTTGIPDDPSFSSQWGMHNTGENGGTADADIDAPEAWDKATGSSEIVVAVVDEGVDVTHPDLAANIWTNSGEVDGNGVDDDGNGFVDDVHGWDFKHDDASVYDGASEDRHATEVAGIIGSVGDNGNGTAGVCWTVRIMSVKFIANGTGTVSDAVLALEYAVRNGARVINCSWGGTSYSASLKAAFDDVLSAGVLVSTSAGNSGKDTDQKSHYPSNYDLPNIISVAATDRNDQLSSFSNYGLTTVDLGAPGSSVYTTVPEGGYSSFSGTSAAAPFVTGAAALALSVSPGLGYQDLKDRILNAVDPIDALTGKTVTGGRLNVNNLIGGLNTGDADGDGLPDAYENQYGLNPADPSDADDDTDGDGLSNLQEYQTGTLPTVPDTDGDGLPDGFEVTYLLDPTSDADASLDNDGDGLSNLVEYGAGTRPDRTDTDGDGIGDYTEFGPRSSAADSDGDGTVDALDLDSDDDGKSDASEGVGDADGDGAANYVDMDDTDGPDADADGDGLSNSLEVTYMLFPNLADSDGDGIDDLTEFGPDQAPRDSDGDQEVDALDLDSDNDGALDAAEGTADRDGDGIPNYRDNDDNDGILGDADGDGLINQVEALYGMNVNLSDSDSDGIDDLTEFGSGTEPLDSDGDGTIDALDRDSDNDGASDQSENGKDSDGDGTPDRLDPDSATMTTGYGKLSLVVGEAGAALQNVTFLAQAAPEAVIDGFDFSYGGVQYAISGLQAGQSVEVLLEAESDFPARTEFWKYDSTNGYEAFPAVVSGSVIRISLTDGGPGDDDGGADGSISDPGYIVVAVTTSDSGSGASSPAGGGGGGGGGGGCALTRTAGATGPVDLCVLLLPLTILLLRKWAAQWLNPRARFRA